MSSVQGKLEKKFDEFNTLFSKKAYNKWWSLMGDESSTYYPLKKVPIIVKALPALIGGKFTGKTIEINKDQGYEDQVDTLLHEMIHLAIWQWYGSEDDYHGPVFKTLYKVITGDNYIVGDTKENFKGDYMSKAERVLGLLEEINV